MDAPTYTHNCGRLWGIYVSAAWHRGKTIRIVIELSINRKNHHHKHDHDRSYNQNQNHNRDHEDDRNELHKHNLTQDRSDDLNLLHNHDHKHVIIAGAVHRSFWFPYVFYAKRLQN